MFKLATPLKHDLDFCTYCPKMCRFACEISEVEKNELQTPWGKQQLTKRVFEGVQPLNSNLAKLAYKDLDSALTQVFCRHHIDVSRGQQFLREEAVRLNQAPEVVLQKLQNFETFHNPYEQDLQDRLLSISSNLRHATQANTLFFPSCHALALDPNAVLATFSIFKKLQIQTVVPFQETLQCCGHALWRFGFREKFATLAEIQYESLKNWETIVVGSPSCAWALKELYPQWGYSFKSTILTLPEFLIESFDQFALKSRPGRMKPYFYHDSPYLGRKLGCYDPPRLLLKTVTGIEPKEFSWNRQQAFSSGAEGTYSLVEPEYAQQIGRRLIAEMKQSGVETLVTSCAVSAKHLRAIDSTIVVKDWANFLEEGLG